MKNILSTLLIFIAFLGFILTPIFIGVHASMMDMGGSEIGCIEHCLGSLIDAGNISAGISEISSKIIFLQNIFTQLFIFTLPLVSLYLLIVYPSPILSTYIKNYSYSLLRGIIISTT